MKSLCFIQWDTACKVGDIYSSFYNLPQCRNWISEEINRIVKDINEVRRNLRKAISYPERRKLLHWRNKLFSYKGKADLMEEDCQEKAAIFLSPRIDLEF